ncbi:MAG TPA: DUF2892 domain-containing protein [Candidatus Manganitrophaceae bacterium]|nr:DUF2892 domain-containing protein [Candidatus Manganitrophaceae bacterium]
MRSYNVGGWDQRIRYGIGVVLPIMGIFSKQSPWLRALFWIVGLNGLLTAYFKFSPLNKLIGYSSYPKGRGILRALRYAR